MANRTNQWSSNNEANGVPISSPRYVKKAANALNANNIWQNQDPAVANIGGQAVGVFGIDATEMSTVSSPGIHTGWVKQTIGTGRRAGRVQYETLVAGGIKGNSGHGANSSFNIVIWNEPAAVNGVHPQTMTVNATSKNGVSLTYEWRFAANDLALSANSTYINVTARALIINTATGTGNAYYCAVSDGAANVHSSSVVGVVT